MTTMRNRLKEMAIGSAFSCDQKQYNNVRSAAAQIGIKLRCRKQSTGLLQVWKVDDRLGRIAINKDGETVWEWY